MPISRLALVCTLGAAVFAATSSFAAPLVEESFDYSDTIADDGNVAGANGGTGFTGAWVNTRNSPDYRTAGLSAGDLVVSGGHAQGAAWSGIARPIGSTLLDAGLLDDGATLWFSVIMDLATANLSNADLNMALTNASKFNSSDFGNRTDLEGATSQGIGTGHTGGNIRGVHWIDSGDADSVAERNLSGTSSMQIDPNGVNNPTGYLIVGKIEWGVGAAAAETITLYNPDTNLNLGTPALAATATAALNQTTFDTIAIQFKDSTPNIDEIRFGATSDDVLPAIPEPGSLALLALGGLTLLSARRRQS